MAPIKFEEQLKDKLEQRKLQPSEQAWSKLANRLDNQEKKENRSLWWLGIAASIIIILAVSIPYFNNDSENTQPIIVDVDTKKETPKENSNQEVTNEVVQEVVNEIKEDAIVETKKPVVNKEDNLIIKEPKAVVKNAVVKSEEAFVNIAKPIEAIKKEVVEPVEELKTFEEVKILDVVAEIQKMQQEPSGVTDREIDSLLKVAHKEILTQRIYNETSKTVDADALLQDVEADLEQSFRSKVFEALKTNYSKVKTAVAERNN